MRQMKMHLPPAPKIIVRFEIQPFDFERDGHRTRCAPRHNATIPAWLALPTDDPAWRPDVMARI